MNLTFTYDSSVSNPTTGLSSSSQAALKTVMQQAAAIMDTLVSNPISLTLKVTWGGAFYGATEGLGSTAATTWSTLSNSLTTAYATNGTSVLGSELPTASPSSGTPALTQAQAKAWGFTSLPANTGNVAFFSSDGTINFGASLDPTKPEFLACALNSIAQAIGVAADPVSTAVTAADLFTYTGAGTLASLYATSNASTSGYFSVDKGVTNLGSMAGSTYASGVPFSNQWATSTLHDAFGIFSGGTGFDSTNSSQSVYGGGFITPTDMLMLSASGFQVAPAIIQGPTSVNEGQHAVLEVSTLSSQYSTHGIAAGATLNYTISGINTTVLSSGSLNGTVTIGANNEGFIDLAISAAANLSSVTNANITLSENGLTLATYALAINPTAYSTTTAPTSNSTVTMSQQPANTVQAGASGTNTAVYANNEATYNAWSAGDGVVQVQNVLTGQTDSLLNFQRVQFADKSLAFDMGATQSGGMAADIIGAAFGVSALSNQGLVHAGISLFDGGWTMQKVAQTILIDNFMYLPTGNSIADDQSFVSALWKNLTGTTISSSGLSYWTGEITNGTFTQQSLLVAAANCALNQTHINLVGLAETGLAFHA